MATTNGKALTERIAEKTPEKANIQNVLSNPLIKERVSEILKARAAGFSTSVIQLVNASAQLKECDPNTILGACLTAATLDLPINPQLGFAAIVPYGGKAQFQPMWRAYFQLALRTGQYKNIIVTEIYEDELRFYNPITDEIEFTSRDEWKMRYTDNGVVVGYYAKYCLISGFEKAVYMTKSEMVKHGKKYSKSYHKADSKWQTDFDAMGKKTVIKRLLSKYGILSVEMQKLIVTDQAIISKEGEPVYIDNIDTDQIIDVEAEDIEGGANE